MNNQAGTTPRIAILLCTYQGQRFLQEQLDSFAAQSYPNWELWVSDDGSKDGTHDILERAKGRLGDRMSIHNGPQEGFCANFLSLACKADIQTDYYAYSDQDDIWQADKLQRAVAKLSAVPHGTSAVYCSRTLVVDANDKSICMSPLFAKTPSFANALMQNIGGGNTMVFNEAARKLLITAGDKVNVVTHDWWVYLLVSGCGGQVFYDATPTVRYRQHGNNLVGMNSSWRARLKRIHLLLQGRFRHWNDLNTSALEPVRDLLSLTSRRTLDEFLAARKKSLIPRLVGLKRSGVYRQSWLSNLGLIVAAIFNKI
ncbi:MAG: glycosyltransferase family 2 protein [Nitrosospira sp.]|nr:glycosyltransferase family 2 protein [Nitrosospira sp.]